MVAATGVIGVEAVKSELPVLLVPLIEAGFESANGKALLLRE